MERCPNCRARTNGTANCRRCGMDHRLLLAAERAADRWLRWAVVAFSTNNPGAAERALKRSLSFRRDPLAEALLELLRKESREIACNWQRSAAESAEPLPTNGDL